MKTRYEHTEEDVEPPGTLPVIGDYICCFGDSTWREDGQPFLVTGEEFPDFITEDGLNGKGYWDRNKFAPFPTNPRIYVSRYYRVIKRKT